jgi:hypothetical protein
MDPNIWSELPYDMVREILGHVDDIDVRLAFGLKPRRNRLPMFDLKITPLIWTPLFAGSAMYICEIKKLTGKFIYNDQVEYLSFLAPHMWHIAS